jgi:hypothetical protein
LFKLPDTFEKQCNLFCKFFDNSVFVHETFIGQKQGFTSITQKTVNGYKKTNHFALALRALKCPARALLIISRWRKSWRN